MSKYRNNAGAFVPRLMVDDIIAENHFCTILGAIYMWIDGRYVTNIKDMIEAICEEKDPDSTPANWDTVYKKLNARKKQFTRFDEVDPYRMAFMNGVLDLKTLDFETENLHRFAVINKVPWNYNLEAEYQPQVAESIKKWADYNETVEHLLYQVIGSPMLVNTDLRTMFLLFGKGQCGKSKFAEYMEYIYGEDNYATFDIAELDKRFNKAQTCGKMFNYSDDIDKDYIEKPNYLKRLAAGVRSMQVENKGENGYKAQFYAKIIMSLNEFPKIKMDTDTTAWSSRMNIIHFKHKFETNGDYRTWERKNLKTREAIEWLLVQAAKAIHEAVEAGKFCFNDEELFNKFMENNAPLMYDALEMTLEQWNEYEDIKRWFDTTEQDTKTKLSFRKFMTMFNAQSEDLEIYRTTSDKKGSDRKVYKVRKK